MATAGQKFGAALMGGVLFFLVANPKAFQLTNRLTTRLSPTLATEFGGVPTQIGVLIHALIFVLVLFLLMKP